MKSILGIILSVFCVSNVLAQANITTNTINQSFAVFSTNAEGNLPRNWRLSKSATERTVTSYPFNPIVKADTTTQFRAGSLMANPSPAGFYNFGVGDSTTASNRAFGFLADGANFKTGNLFFHIKNANTSLNITSFSVEFFVRKFKNGTNPAGFNIKLFYSRNGINWTDAGTDFYSEFTADADNNGLTILSSTPVNDARSGVINEVLTPGQQFYFAWSYSVKSGSTTTNAPALGIDAIIITPTTVLPVTLVKFEAEKLAEKVKLLWTTATEINNEKFIIEKSNNGKEFKFLSEIKAQALQKN